MLLQLPVFLGLYYMLRNQGSVNGYVDAGSFATVWHAEPVSWLWIGDITKFDLALMFVYIGSQFAASWQMSRKSAGQQRMIAVLMPVMVGIFMFTGKWPAGLMIYWFTSNLWSIAQQFVAERIMPVPVAAAAVLEKDRAKLAQGKSGAKKASGSSARVPAQPKNTSTQPGGQSAARAGAKSGGNSGAKRKRQKR
jgi:YidC/Oxa1 family membrane protein insertase